jgi:non-specific serine/threonine protein kinase/serine/threonine-protein kinase
VTGPIGDDALSRVAGVLRGEQTVLTSDSTVTSAEAPKQVGPYEILEPLGEGGMGTVFRAKQTRPIQRVVALKLIKLGMDSRQVLARFEAERQTMSLLEHPGIARVLDAGLCDESAGLYRGRPYFAMELVSGQPITRFADEKMLSIRQRLELFAAVCDAVQHAHSKGVIHRDLKPSNVLVAEVDGQPIPKVIDFGIAKAIDQTQLRNLTMTQEGMIVGSPEYMSPEQAAGSADIDTRSDVYSLGVMLYELLTGGLPFDPEELRSKAIFEMLRVIQEDAPPRPSTRLSRLGAAKLIAERRQTKLQSLRFELRRELEWIPLKAMRKDRDSRYASAQELGQDVRRYLRGETLLAGPESGFYRARKFVARNKLLVGAATAVGLALIAGVATTTWQAIRATNAERKAVASAEESERQRKLAEDQRDAADTATDFLVGIIRSNDPEQTRGRPVLLAEVLGRASKDVRQRLVGKPEVAARINAALGGAFASLGASEQALPHLREALDLRIKIDGPDSAEVAFAEMDLASLLNDMGRADRAEPLARRSMAAIDRHVGADTLTAARNRFRLAVILFGAGQDTEALEFSRAAYESVRSRGDAADLLDAVTSYVLILDGVGKNEEAAKLLQELLPIAIRERGDDHPTTIVATSNLAMQLMKLRQFEQAEQLQRRAIELGRRVFGEAHFNTLAYMNNLTSIMLRTGRFDEAAENARFVLAKQRQALGNDHPDTLTGLSNLGGALLEGGKGGEAEPVFREALERSRRIRGDAHPQTLVAMRNLALALRGAGRTDEMLSLLREAWAVCEKNLPEDHPVYISTCNALAVAMRESGQLAAAEPLARRALELAIKHRGAGDPTVRHYADNLARTLEALKRPDEARAIRDTYLASPATSPASQPASAPT